MAGSWFCELAGHDEVARRWKEASALGGYTIGGLVAHVGAAVAWLGAVIDTSEPEGVPVIGLGDYYGPFAVRTNDDLDSAVHTMLRAQGERGAEAGATDTVAKLRTRVDKLGQRLTDEDGSRLLDLRPSLPVTMRLDDFVATRVVELVVHGDDLAVSAGITAQPPPEGSASTIETLMTTVVTQHGDLEVIRALARSERSQARVFPAL
ncbi:MAG TPA: maleylpyruvate isomerase family mycothiol-dependent enzyme [Nocardioidaceae bacterium]|nr:maleylpyruvate isomerase family mycothiol-dependent enzyme [Nocardioidaceae bacterium]